MKAHDNSSEPLADELESWDIGEVKDILPEVRFRTMDEPNSISYLHESIDQMIGN